MTTYQFDDIKQIHLNTRTAIKLNGSKNSNVRWNINGLMNKLDDKTLYATVKVLSAEIPRSWYIINETNDRIEIDIDGQSFLIQLKHGNYSSSSFMDMCIPLLPFGMNISFSNTEGIFTFSNTTEEFSITKATTAYTLIGLEPNTNYISTNRILKCVYPANFLGTQNISLKTSTLILNNFNTLDGTNTNLLTLQVNTAPYGSIRYTNLTNTAYLLRNDELSGIEIELRDEYNNLLNMNSIDWSITLELNRRISLIKYEFNNISQYLDQMKQQN